MYRKRASLFCVYDKADTVLCLHKEEKVMKIVQRVSELAEKYGVKMQQIALAWQWAKGVASPIVGAIDHNPADGVMLLDEKK